MTTMTGRAAGRRQAGVLALACAVLFMDGYDLFAIGTVGPSLLHHRAWHPDGGTLGMLGSVTAFGMPFGSVLAGWAADRWGRRAPLAAAMAWISVAMLAAGLAPDLRWFAVARFCAGVGIGALAPLIGAYVTDNAPPRRRTLHLAISMGAIGIGGTASALLGRILLPDVEFQVLFLFGAVSLLLVPVIWWSVPATPPAHAGHTGAKHRLAELLATGRQRVTVTLWVATFMSMVLVYSTTAWLPVVMMKSGYDLGSSLEFSIAFTLGASFGGLGVSMLGDRGHLVLVTFGCFLLAAVALFVLSTPQPRPLLLVMSAVAGLGSLGCQNMVIACMTASAPPRLRGSALGFGLGVGRVGAILGPTYLAVATDAFTSHRAGFFAFMVPAVLGAVTISLLPRRSLAAPE